MIKRIAAYRNGQAPTRSKLAVNRSYIGQTIEERVEKIMHNHEPITDGAPQIYTERNQGVIPEYNIRTDRFDQALDMTEMIHSNAIAKRKERWEKRNPKPEPTTEPKGPTAPTPTATQTTPNKG